MHTNLLLTKPALIQNQTTGIWHMLIAFPAKTNKRVQIKD